MYINCERLFLYYTLSSLQGAPSFDSSTGMTNCIDSDNDILILDWTVGYVVFKLFLVISSIIGSTGSK